MSAIMPFPFTTVADESAPIRLHDAGFHYDTPSPATEMLYWRESGDAVLLRPHPDHPGFLIAEISAKDLPGLLTIVEPSI